MSITDIQLNDTTGSNITGDYQNVTARTVATRRGMEVGELPIGAIKTISPASNTDVNFTHRYIYTGDGGDITVRFESGGTAYTFTLPAGALMPMTIYSIDSFTGSDLHIMN